MNTNFSGSYGNAAFTDKSDGSTPNVIIKTWYSGMSNFVTSNYAEIIIPRSALSEYIINSGKRSYRSYSIIENWAE